MNGTIFSVTLAIDLMPPTITANTTAANTSPVIQPGIFADNSRNLRMCLVGLEHVAATKRAENTEDREHDREELAAGKPQLGLKPLEM
jgi:hypothetical protein